MNGVRFLLAKYVSDLRRMEPRNIGVIVWRGGEVAARFLAEREDRPGEIDGRSVPNFVTSISAYKQWIEYWRSESAKPAIRPLRGGEPVPRVSSEFLNVLTSANRGNFLLTEAGASLDPIPEGGLADLANFLFKQLVEEPAGVEEPRDQSLESVCEKIIEDSSLAGHPYFRRNYPLTCTIDGGTEERFEFSYAYGNGRPLRLYHLLPLPKRIRPKALTKNVHHVAWMFEKVIHARKISKEQGGVLIFPTEDQNEDQDVKQSLDVLGSITRVLNLQDEEVIRSEFSSLPRLAVDHQLEQSGQDNLGINPD